MNATSKLGNTDLMDSSFFGNVKCLQPLIQAGADVNMRDNEGFTALIGAVYFASFKCIKPLLDAGADVNAVTKDGRTALMVAAMHSYTKTFMIQEQM